MKEDRPRERQNVSSILQENVSVRHFKYSLPFQLSQNLLGEDSKLEITKKLAKNLFMLYFYVDR